ncbi:hypothetical protein DSM112329_02977 [Paraconexibacter sp. AEG42_29]|uniref:Uncharacterized protein n=1 Tax=Paraconexibacter sp. AEG42_29 TaxID=2997339 RepID=A0AAU7AWV7_9ACTN
MAESQDAQLAGLYGDIVTAGGLGPVLEGVLGPGFSVTRAGFYEAVVRRCDPGREQDILSGRHWRASVGVALLERLFHVDLAPAGHGVALAGGWMRSEHEAWALIASALDAADVRPIVDGCSDLSWSSNGLAVLSGDETEWWWQFHLAETHDPLPVLAPLIAAAAAQPRLRQLRPYTSMWSLCFSRCTRYPFSDEGPFIEAGRDPRTNATTYTVSASPQQARRPRVVLADPVEAAAYAAGLVPANSPAVAGSGPD